MSDAATLHHITIETGHTRRSPRSEVGDDAIATCADMLRDARGGRHARIPGVGPGYTITVGAEGDLMIATIWRGPDVPIATLGVARSDRDALRLWALLRRAPDEPALSRDRAPDRPPPAPWCAVRLEPGLVLHPDAAVWLGDFERCLAWSWLGMSNPGA